jgi:BASS family bile acid:Na+ symporter
MTLAQATGLAINVSMGLIVFCIALGVRPADILPLVRSPGMLLRSIIAMYVVMPLVALALAIAFDFRHAVEVALVTMALAPIPPILPGKQIRSGGNPARTLGILTLTAAASVAFIPLAVELIGRIFRRDLAIPASIIFKMVAISLLLPAMAGMSVRQFAPRLADRIARPLSLFAMILLVAAFIPVLVKVWPAMMALIGDFTVVAIALFSAIGLLVGHVLGGPDAGDRTVLALAAATGHPGIAIGIAHATNPDDPGIPAAVLLVLLAGAVASVPYVIWRRKARGGMA